MIEKNSEITPVDNDNHEQSKKEVSIRSILVLTVFLSLGFGLIGGIAGIRYAASNPLLARLIHGQSEETIAKSIILQEDSAIINSVKKASPSVVSVVVSKDISSNRNSFSPFFPFFESEPAGPNNSSQPNFQQVGAGSGFFVSKDGLVLTNKHVVSDQQAQYTIVTNDGRTYQAEVLSRDPAGDLAILKVKGVTEVPFLELAKNEIQLGQRVIAIGNSLGQYRNTVTSGIISGIGRSVVAGGSEGSEQLEGVIQTDAAINPGNSGGPLLDLNGKVVGINTAVDREGQLVGFALPAADAAAVLQTFQQTGKITRPFLGVRYVIVNPELAKDQNLKVDQGAYVVRSQKDSDSGVVEGSPAAQAGVQEGDVITEINGKKINAEFSLSRAMRQLKVGDRIDLKINRDGKNISLGVTLGENK